MPALSAERSLKPLRRIVLVVTLALVAALLPVGLPSAFLSSAAAADPCAPLINAIACENSKPGSPPSEWDIRVPATDIQGFATQISVNRASRSFKVDTTAANYTIGIYRTGWYQGKGARKIADVTPSVLTAEPAALPHRRQHGALRLRHVGRVGIMAGSRAARSGVYIALLTRPDNGSRAISRSWSEMMRATRTSSSRLPTPRGRRTTPTADPTSMRAPRTAGPTRSATTAPSTLEAARADGTSTSQRIPDGPLPGKNGYDVSYISGVDTDRAAGCSQPQDFPLGGPR